MEEMKETTIRFELEGGEKEVKVQLTKQAINVSEAMELFEDFLKGCGYSLGGHIQVIEDEE